MVFPIGSLDGTVVCAVENVTIFDDDILEGLESFMLTVESQVSLYSLGIPSLASVLIDDDEDGML